MTAVDLTIIKEKLYRFLALIIVLGIAALCFFMPQLIARIMPGEKELEFGSSGEFSREPVLQTAEQILILVGQGDVSKLLKEHGAWGTNTGENVAAIRTQIEEVSQDWGAYQSFSVVKLAELKLEGNLYAMVQVEAKYENVTVPTRIYLDTEGKLTGIHFDTKVPTDPQK